MWLVSSDWHLSESSQELHKENLLFDLMLKTVKENNVSHVFILGDITDKKDIFSSMFVNRVENFFKILSNSCHVTLLRGNHDCIDEQNPFFYFLNDVGNSKIDYIVSPQKRNIEGKRVLLLPNSRVPDKDWDAKLLESAKKADMVFMHQTLTGAKAEAGISLVGIDAGTFSGCKEVISGDVHVPQTLSNIVYVGSPYHVHYGDKFIPRMLIGEPGDWKSMETGLPKKHTIRVPLGQAPDLSKVRNGDSVKVIFIGHPSSWEEWESQKKKQQEIMGPLGLHQFSINIEWDEDLRQKDQMKQENIKSPNEILCSFLAAKYPFNAEQYKTVGLEILKRSQL